MRRGLPAARRRAPGILALIAALSFPACAGRSAQDKELNVLRDELAKVQHDHEALERRVEQLEGGESAGAEVNASSVVVVAGAPSGNANAASSNAASSNAASLKVVKLEPPQAAGTTTTSTPPPPNKTTDDDDDGPRPMLKIGSDGVIEETWPDESTAKKGKSKKPSLDPKALKEYDASLALFKNKKFKAALDGFTGFVVRWPDHPYAGNALFWRGECYFAMGEYGAAVDQYDGLLATYPASPKIPDALLKLGLAHKKLGSDTKAKAAFTRLRKEFPTSEAAKKIPPEDAS